ncbi:hypothetical protein [Micromonospora sp. WMMD1082]|uniref:hypothetical protein n=1 Tax=Micromonospora sp. WMMD1082 TaxID=3016104 RepID=UPI00241639F2|nr:hypothetical protein [Micromonospora sp. WMMD1082]MDG4792422.1 hypothetical protein [Micromonospora sp. WMMD1082]
MSGTGAERLRQHTQRCSEATGRTLHPDQAYTDAVWESKALTSTQKIAALCYANHARRGSRDRAWVAYPWLMTQTGIRSRETASAVLRALVDAGWLEPVGKHKRSVVYALALPADADAVPAVAPDRSRLFRELARRSAEARHTQQTGTADVPVGGEIGTAAQPTGTDAVPTSVRKSAPPVRQTYRNGTADVRDSLSERTLQGDSQGDDSPRRDAAATLRAATPDAEGATLDGERARAQIRERLAATGARPVSLSRWKRPRAKDEPNPHFAGYRQDDEGGAA